MAIRLRNLPGVSFRAVAPEVDDALPRMDVAALVGFAASGPLHVPVAVEDEVRFAELFGDDLELARTESGEPVHAHLAASVRAFFRNGGAKCYVVRVAGGEAVCNRFPVPGLMAVAGPGGAAHGEVSGAWRPPYRAVSLWARSEGAWSDGLRVGTLLHQEPYSVQALAVEGGRLRVTLGCAGSPPPQPGDLIRIDQAARAAGSWSGEGSPGEPAFGLAGSLRVYLVVESVETPAGGSAPWAGRTVVVDGREAWFAVLSVPAASSPPASPPSSPPSPESGVPLAVDVIPLPPDGRLGPRAEAGEEEPPGEPPAGLPARWFPPAEPGKPHRFVVPFDAGLGVGTLFQAAEAGSPPAGAGWVIACVGEVRPPSQDELEAVHELGDRRWQTLLVDEVLLPLDGATARPLLAAQAPADLWADRITFDLWVQEESGRTFILERLGFSPASPRYAGFLPSDRLLFSDPKSRGPAADGPAPGREIWAEADHPRFPLAAWFAPEAAGPGASVDDWFPTFLPVGMARVRRLEATAGRAAGDSGALDKETRNGLRTFEAALFLDPALAGSSSQTLIEAAFHLQHVVGRPPRGMHAVLPLEEVTLIAAPDAVHAPWEASAPRVVRVLQAPVLAPIAGAAPGESFEVAWSEVAPVSDQPLQYLVEEAPVPDFSRGVVRRRTQEPSLQLPVSEPCESVRYFRVRAEQRDEWGPWSNTEVVVLPRRAFVPCGRTLPPPPTPPAPVLMAPVRLNDGSWELQWHAGPVPGEGEELVFQVEQAHSPDFADAQTAYQGSDTHAHLFLGAGDLREAASPVRYVRARTMAGGAWGPWSNTAILILADAIVGGYRTVPGPADGTVAGRVHAALLTLCRARADMTCVLSLPSGFDSQRAIEYADGLAASFGPGQQDVLGYGALYHPWTWVAQPGRTARMIPPDGSALGIIAARTLRRGAWVAPANAPVSDVIALAGEPADPRPLYGAGLNLIVREARGFTLLGADTLAADASVRPLSVRRLLILLRKLALREGAAMVFAPNDAPLRRRIRRRFEDVLGRLFALGAFAGATPDEAFQVATDTGAAFRQNADRGIVVVELRVAPSRPLEFIRVRLVQTEGSGTAVVEG